MCELKRNLQGFFVSSPNPTSGSKFLYRSLGVSDTRSTLSGVLFVPFTEGHVLFVVFSNVSFLLLLLGNPSYPFSFFLPCATPKKLYGSFPLPGRTRPLPPRRALLVPCLSFLFFFCEMMANVFCAVGGFPLLSRFTFSPAVRSFFSTPIFVFPFRFIARLPPPPPTRPCPRGKTLVDAFPPFSPCRHSQFHFTPVIIERKKGKYSPPPFIPLSFSIRSQPKLSSFGFSLAIYCSLLEIFLNISFALPNNVLQLLKYPGGEMNPQITPMVGPN